MNITADWFSNNIPFWEKELAKYKGVAGVRVLEIGAFEGMATVWLANFIGNDFRYQVVDTFEGSIEHKDNNFSFDGVYDRFLENIKPVQEKGIFGIHKEKSIEYLVSRLPGSLHNDNIGFDIIYIDGSHMAADVLTDAVLSFPMLKPGGVMIFDDYEWNAYPEPEKTPKAAINAFLQCFAGQYNLIRKEYQVVIEKI